MTLEPTHHLSDSAMPDDQALQRPLAANAACGLAKDIGLSSGDAAVATAKQGFFNRPILYEEPLKWFLLLSCLDILFTWVVLHLGGSEVNWVARMFLEHGDLYGLVGFKFTMVVAIVLLCDFVGRRNDSRGRFIARASVIITSFPVILASMQLLIFMYA